MPRPAAKTLRSVLFGLNLSLLAGVGLLGGDLVRAQEPSLPDFDPLKYALDEGPAGPRRDYAVVWRELDDPKPKPDPAPTQPTIQAPAPSACPWTLALVLLDEERSASSAVILQDRGGRQRAVGVGRLVDPQRKAYRLEGVRIEQDTTHVHAIATLVRLADQRPLELRLSRPLRRVAADN